MSRVLVQAWPPEFGPPELKFWSGGVYVYNLRSYRKMEAWDQGPLDIHRAASMKLADEKKEKPCLKVEGED